MEANTEQLLRDLASQLGTTVEHLWPQLVARQAIVSQLEVAVLLGVAIIYPTVATRIISSIKSVPDRSGTKAALIVVGGFFYLMFLVCISTTIGNALYPEAAVIGNLIKDAG